jgi:hypothetical protein
VRETSHRALARPRAFEPPCVQDNNNDRRVSMINFRMSIDLPELRFCEPKWFLDLWEFLGDNPRTSQVLRSNNRLAMRGCRDLVSEFGDEKLNELDDVRLFQFLATFWRFIREKVMQEEAARNLASS